MSLTDMSVKEIDAKIKKHEEEIDKLREARKIVEGLTEAQQLATVLHAKQCHHNHIDGCGWYYESWTKDVPANRGGTRQRWVEKAEKLLSTGKSLEELVEIAELMS
jgi:hypothetical protein